MSAEPNNSYRNIVVCGDVGTGTTTLAKGLAKKLGWEYLSAGDIFRKYHKEHGIPLWDKASIPDELDKKVDTGFFEKMKKESGLVVDGHYAGWFAKDLKSVFRILLTCDKKVADDRIISRQATHQETPEQIEERRKQLRDKFKKLYSSEDYEDPEFFNLIIDTTNTSIEDTLSIAFQKFSQDS
jgi:cytidylate kinase